MVANSWQISASTATIRKLQEELLAFFRRRVQQTQDARDLSSRTWLAAGARFEGRSSLRYYLFVIARRMVADYWRALRRPGFRSPSTAEDELELAALYAPDDLDRELSHRYGGTAIVRELERLPEEYRDVLELKLWGLNNHQIAEALGIAYHTVRSRASRGKAKLLEALEGEI